MEPWLWAIIIPVTAALVGVIYWAGQSRDDKQDERHERNEKDLSDHIKEDVKVHERVAVLESSQKTHEKRLNEVEVYAEDIKHLHVDVMEREIGKIDQRLKQAEERAKK